MNTYPTRPAATHHETPETASVSEIVETSVVAAARHADGCDCETCDYPPAPPQDSFSLAIRTRRLAAEGS